MEEFKLLVEDFIVISELPEEEQVFNFDFRKNITALFRNINE